MDLNAQVYYVPLSPIVMGKIEKGSKNTITSYFSMTCYNNPQIMNQNKLTLCNNREKSNICDKKLHLHNKWPFFALFFFPFLPRWGNRKKGLFNFDFPYTSSQKRVEQWKVFAYGKEKLSIQYICKRVLPWKAMPMETAKNS